MLSCEIIDIEFESKSYEFPQYGCLKSVVHSMGIN